jgi:WD40 repeat protein
LNKKVDEEENIRHAESVLSIKTDDDNMITASDNGEIFTWDLNNEEFINKYSNDFRCNSISYNREDSRLVFAGVKTEKDGRKIYKIAACNVSDDMWHAESGDDKSADLGAEDYKITSNQVIDVAQNSSGIVFIEKDKLTVADDETKLDNTATTLATQFNSDNVFVGFEDGRIVEYPGGNAFDANIGSPVTKIKILNDKLIAGYGDGSIVIFEESRSTKLEAHQKAITNFHVDDSQIISLSEDNTVRFWDINDGECTYTYFLDIFATAINFKDGKLVIGDTLGNVRFFEFKN